MEPQTIDLVVRYLKPETFYVEAHQEVFRAMLALSMKGQSPDLITVANELRTDGRLEKMGGPFFLTKMTNAVVSSANIEDHCRIIHQHFIGRELIRICGQTIGDVYEPGSDGLSAMMMLDKEITALSENEFGGDAKDMGEVLVDTVKKIEAWRVKGEAVTGVPSGFVKIDEATRGWQGGDLIILAARPSVGKTAFALSLARNAARHGCPVVIWSLEMAASSLALRMLSAESGIRLNQIQTGGIDDQEMKRLYKEGIDPLTRTKVFMDDGSGLTLMKIKAKARRLKRKHGIGMIIVDYLQLMEEDEREHNRERQIAKTSRGLKNLALELQIPIIALSQLSRDVEKRTGSKRTPMLSDLRESGAIEQDADVCMFLYAADQDDIDRDPSLDGIRYCKIAKQRNGVLLTTEVNFEKGIQRFIDPKSSGWKAVTVPAGLRSPLNKESDPF